MPKCAFLSIANTEGWFIDDDLVHPHLEALGWEVKNIPWNQATEWDEFDLVLVRSPWDYQQHLKEFQKVLSQIQRSKAILLNSLELMQWNIHKGYLFELQEKGVELVPTIRFSSLEKEAIEQAFENLNSDQLIIKPLIGANADDTFWIRRDQAESWEKALSIFAEKEGMIQPFMHAIVEEGEFSLMYFQGSLSHTILKTVGEGDFRVQEEHGGGVIPIEKPEAELLEAADKAMKSLPETPFYARVDLVRTASNSFALMELELIEPCLYFRFDEKSPALFAEMLDQYWKKHLEPIRN